MREIEGKKTVVNETDIKGALLAIENRSGNLIWFERDDYDRVVAEIVPVDGMDPIPGISAMLGEDVQLTFETAA